MARCILRSWGCSMLFALLVPNLTGCGATPAPLDNKKPEMVWATLKIRAVEPSVWSRSQNKVNLAEFKFYMSDVLSEIKGDLVIDRALDDKAVQNVPSIKAAGLDASTWLADQLVVENQEGSEIIRVGLPDDANHDTHIIVNAVVNAFLDKVVNKERSEKLIRRDLVEKKLDMYKAVLSAKRTAMHELAEQSKSQNLITEANRSISKAKWNKATEQAMAAEFELTHAKANLSHLQTKDPSYEAAKKSFESATIDVEFWTKEVSSAKAEIAALAVGLGKGGSSSSDQDQLSDEVRQLQNVTNTMGEMLTEWNIELDAPARVEKLGDAHAANDAGAR
jgi:hypothetical protein